MASLQAAKTQARFVPYVKQEICKPCERCAAQKQCKTRALIQLDRGESPHIDAGRCYGCHKCLLACPYAAILLPLQEGE